MIFVEFRLDFAFPGYEVATKDPAIYGTIEKFTAHTGSSVSTAIASGFVALIMECVHVGCVYEFDKPNSDDYPSLDIQDWKKFFRRDGMIEAFRSFETKAKSNEKFLAVDKVFIEYVIKLESQDKDGKAHYISKLAQQLLQKGLQAK